MYCKVVKLIFKLNLKYKCIVHVIIFRQKKVKKRNQNVGSTYSRSLLYLISSSFFALHKRVFFIISLFFVCRVSENIIVNDYLFFFFCQIGIFHHAHRTKLAMTRFFVDKKCLYNTLVFLSLFFTIIIPLQLYSNFRIEEIKVNIKFVQLNKNIKCSVAIAVAVAQKILQKFP